MNYNNSDEAALLGYKNRQGDCGISDDTNLIYLTDCLYRAPDEIPSVGIMAIAIFESYSLFAQREM